MTSFFIFSLLGGMRFRCEVSVGRSADCGSNFDLALLSLGSSAVLSISVVREIVHIRTSYNCTMICRRHVRFFIGVKRFDTLVSNGMSNFSEPANDLLRCRK